MGSKWLFIYPLLCTAGLEGYAQSPVLADTLYAPGPSKSVLGSMPTHGGSARAVPAKRPERVAETPLPLSLGISLGWGAPYAAGIELTYRIRPEVDATIGAGLGSSGAKVGAGGRYYFSSSSRNHLFVGTNLVYSYSEVELDLDDKGVLGRYIMHSSMLWHLRVGLHRQRRRNAMLLTGGYGVLLGPHPVIELVPNYGPGSATSHNFLELAGPGGVEISITYLFGLGNSRGYRH